MIIQEKQIKEVLRLLSILADYLHTAGKLNLNDGSVISENLCERLMNIVYGYELENINLIKQNAAVIDLYDKKKRIAVQVTSNSKLDKVRSCLKGFMDKELYKDYDELYIYVLTTKQSSYSIQPVSKDKFSFDWKHYVIDKSDIVSRLQPHDDPTTKEVVDLLVRSINGKITTVNRSNEVETIINLISLLSGNDIDVDSVFDENSEIDPNQKISKRYPDNYESIEEQYIDLCTQYSEVMSTIISNNDISAVKHSKVGLYLRSRSRELLSKHNNDASLAFDELKNEVVEMFNAENSSYDEMAIQYFLYNQLVLCNVFPLPRVRKNVPIS
ncbi:SMEK domain-containing protein [Vibrio splendidus]|uniref:SMEK domain-containing protein n=1 Tax=Vibrio splendidus TaxID=29497 RepID=UPI000D3D256A|nr:SMEK domain-containing protein [Vibrio splendidus]PTP81954.1 hypothetical protein CWO03_22315 [Vibrio splendidus]